MAHSFFISFAKLEESLWMNDYLKHHFNRMFITHDPFIAAISIKQFDYTSHFHFLGTIF
jgi:hypothetical protein